MKGRKPVPTSLKIVSNNPGKRPMNRNEPQPEIRLPTCPAHIVGAARTEWKRLSHELFNLGMLTGLDRAAFAGYCESYGTWVDARRAFAMMARKDKVTGGLLIKTSNGNLIQNPIIGIANRARSDMIKFSAEFGMTPSARSRIEVPSGQTTKSKTARFFD